MGKLKQIWEMKYFIRIITPPIIYSLGIRMIKMAMRWYIKPDVQTITGGPLKGNVIYINNKMPSFRQMIQGEYDAFFWSHVSPDQFKDGDVILDIGGHIGFHAMNFAKITGPACRVHVFEPNPTNAERIRINFQKNPDLQPKIKLHEFALSNEGNSFAEFTFSSNIEDESSSGGFIKGSHQPLDLAVYSQSDFTKGKVPVEKLDTVVQQEALSSIKLIKIDVEGAEQYVIEGGKETIEKNKPLLLIEIHSVVAMLNVCQLLNQLHYEIKVIKEEDAGRCFIKAWSK